MLPEQLRALVGAPHLWRRALRSLPHHYLEILSSSESQCSLAPIAAFPHPPCPKTTGVVMAGQCQDTAEAGQGQGHAAGYQGSIGLLEATLQGGLEIRAHKKVPAALAGGLRSSNSRFKAERARIEGIRVQG